MCVFGEEGMKKGNVLCWKGKGDLVLELAISEWGKNKGQSTATEISRFVKEEH